MIETRNVVPFTRCKILNYKVVEIETHGERALTIVLGHADMNGLNHPYLQVHVYLRTLQVSRKERLCCPLRECVCYVDKIFSFRHLNLSIYLKQDGKLKHNLVLLTSKCRNNAL